MKIRVGYGLGVNSLTNDQERYGPFVDALERLDYDSLWVSSGSPVTRPTRSCRWPMRRGARRS